MNLILRISRLNYFQAESRLTNNIVNIFKRIYASHQSFSWISDLVHVINYLTSKEKLATVLFLEKQ